MTFKELSIRMFKSNIRRYTLYFACSGFITMVLFLYLTLYTNKDFNTPYKVDSSISGNLFAPTLVLFIFATCFIIYAHNYFIKFRKKDFALFMIIGMTENDISYSANESINNNIIIQNPYDLAYAEIYGKNEISEDTLNNTLKSNDIKVESINSLEIVVQGSTVMMSDKSLNNLLGSNFNVERGKYICLLQINRNDGYVHNEQEIENYTINNTTYILQEKLEKILFNKMPIFNNSHYLIFNQDDYKEIKSSVKSQYIGNVKFINFNDWTKTETVVNNLTDELENYNKINTKQFFGSTNDDRRQFKPVSKIIDYKLLKESSQFLTFLLCFVFILFFISSNLIIHFKLLTEFDNEKIKYEKLNKIGVLEKEISLNISKELSIIFLLPCILGTYLGTYCIYSKIFSIGISNLHEIRYALITGFAYTVLELIFYLLYKKHYINLLLK